MRKILNEKFFKRDTEKVALDLLGKFLVRKTGKGEIADMITETECYDGMEDKASHASCGKTKRNEVIFGKPGYFYVYLCYGIHFMLNIVTREHGYPGAVLIRGMSKTNGPGKVTKVLKIGKGLNRKTASKASGLWLEDRGVKIKKDMVQKGPRVGVSYAGEKWSVKPLRFMLKLTQ